MQVQLTITFALIAVAGVIALICDFLRISNAQLRKVKAELKACNQARIRGAADLSQMATKPALSNGATREVRPIHRLPQREVQDQAMKSNTALSEWLIQCAVARAAQKAAEESVAVQPLAPAAVPQVAPAPDRVLKLNRMSYRPSRLPSALTLFFGHL